MTELKFGDFGKVKCGSVMRVFHGCQDGWIRAIDSNGLTFQMPSANLTPLPDYVDFDGPPAKLQVEAGKYYRTASGSIVGPALVAKNTPNYSWFINGSWYESDGSYWPDKVSTEDLVAEVPAPPKPEPPKPTPVYVPWTFETMPIVKVYFKGHPDRQRLAVPATGEGVTIAALCETYQFLFDNYVQLDGSPCGTLKS